MNFKKMGTSFLTLAFAGLIMAGCNENDPPLVDDDLEEVTNLMASSGESEVTLSWTASSSTGAQYEISQDGVALDTVTGTAVTVTGLTNGTIYTFGVTSVDPDDDDARSDMVEIDWAPADRYSSDADVAAQQLRIYEKSSTNGSGLVIDTRAPFNGPANVSLSNAQPISELSRAQLALFVEADNATFRFGPAQGFSVADYQNRADFNQTTVISDNFYLVDVNPTDPESSFDNWFLDGPLSEELTNKISPYTNLTDRSDGKGYGFIVRTGSSAADYHYARVIIVPDVNGKVLQGSGNEQYVTLVVSYQNTANVPYAKK